jgi:CO dehydrogenase nickel-insertion accessory protein CooC1
VDVAKGRRDYRKETRLVAEKAKALTGKRIGVFGKGGSGKSTAVVLLAKALGDRGYPVCVLDADSTNLGLYQALGLDESPASLMSYFGGTVFGGGKVTCPVDDPSPLAGAEISLNRLPSRHYVQTQTGMVFLTAGKIGDQGPGAGCDGPISKIARDLWIVAEGEDPVTSASLQIAVNMRDMVDKIRAGELPATAHLESPDLVAIANRVFREARIKGVLFVLSQVDDEGTKAYLRAKLEEKGIRPIGFIRRVPSISLAWLKGLPLDLAETKEDLERIVGELEAAEKAYSGDSGGGQWDRQEESSVARGES